MSQALNLRNLKGWFTDPDGYPSIFKDRDSQQTYLVRFSDIMPDAVFLETEIDDVELIDEGGVTSQLFDFSAVQGREFFFRFRVTGTDGAVRVKVTTEGVYPDIHYATMKFYARKM